ncbi:MAG: DUF86 domain-containing protein [Desulfotignum balticum]|uniref:DUF86 domain-containing protein n=1 Tax=Desulfotignum balticum TaxID=115781 RepID=A0A931CQ57_9BACT|nr:DUF86 domain-containing protein [Desulfotignum balticum]
MKTTLDPEDPAVSIDFSKIAGFRNFLSHDYEAVDSRIICNQNYPAMNRVKPPEWFRFCPMAPE